MLAATWPTTSLSMPVTTTWVGAGTSKLMPSGVRDVDRVAEAGFKRQRVRTLGLGAIADADDLELFLVALGDTDDHVVDEAAGQPVERPVATLVVGARETECAVVLGDFDVAGDGATERALGTVTVTVRLATVTSSGRDRNGRFSDRDMDLLPHQT